MDDKALRSTLTQAKDKLKRQEEAVEATKALIDLIERSLPKDQVKK